MSHRSFLIDIDIHTKNVPATIFFAPGLKFSDPDELWEKFVVAGSIGSITLMVIN